MSNTYLIIDKLNNHNLFFKEEVKIRAEARKFLKAFFQPVKSSASIDNAQTGQSYKDLYQTSISRSGQQITTGNDPCL